MVEEIFGVADEFAFGVEGEALAERFGGAFVEGSHVQLGAWCAAVEFVCGELGAPTERVPDAGIFGAKCDGPFDESQAFSVLATAGDEMCGHLFEGLDVVGVEIECALRQLDAGGDIVRRLAALRFGEQRAGFVVWERQGSPSTSFSASDSVNTWNVFVRTTYVATAASLRKCEQAACLRIHSTPEALLSSARSWGDAF